MKITLYTAFPKLCLKFVIFRLSAAVMESTVVQKTLSVMCPQENASEETNYQWIGLRSCQL